MRYLFLFLCGLPLLTHAQENQKLYSPDIADKIVDFTGPDFRTADARDETGVADGRFGRVYTAMVNKGRPSRKLCTNYRKTCVTALWPVRTTVSPSILRPGHYGCHCFRLPRPDRFFCFVAWPLLAR